MKIFKIVGILVGLLMCSNEFKGQDLKTAFDSAAYVEGYQMGEYFFTNLLGFYNVDAFHAGAKDGIAGYVSKIQEPQRTEVMNAIGEYVQKIKQENFERNTQQNIEIAKKIMEENRQKKDIKETASGLQYQIIKEGKGVKPTATDRVKVHYEGVFSDGTLFDSSIQRGEPVTFFLEGMISGWTEGLQLMSVGGKYKFWIPSELAYGNNPIGNIPNSAGSILVFEVELFEINPE